MFGFQRVEAFWFATTFGLRLVRNLSPEGQQYLNLKSSVLEVQFPGLRKHNKHI